MKKSFLIYCLGALFMFSIVACEKADDSDLIEVENLSQDEIQFMGPSIQAVLPDLRVTSISSTLNVGNVCPGGVPSADATCNGGGSVVFTVTAVVRNQSPVPVNTPFDLDFCVFNAGCGTVQIPSLGAFASTTETFIYSFPCATGLPPYALIQEVVYAMADASFVVNEINENNNYSDRYPVCRNQ